MPPRVPRARRGSAREPGVGERMGKHAQLLQQEDVVVLSAVLHEARAAALASSTSTADGDVELSLLEVGKLEHTSSSMNSPRPSCDLRLGEPPPRVAS